LKHWAAFFLLLAGTAWISWPMFQTLQVTWSDVYGAHSHGYLVLALALGFAVRAWRAPPPVVVGKPVWAALPALLLLLALAVLSEALFIGPSRTALLPLLLLAVIGLCLGANAWWRLAWPVLFLYFALPVWVVFNEPLRRLTTVVSMWLVRATGIPVYVEGSLVHLADGSFEIASGCSGLNYFVAALTLAAVQCTLFLRTWRARGLLMLAACLAALLANWLRVASLILVGHVTGMQHYLIRVEHLWYGWALFLVMMIPVHALGVYLERREHAIGAPKSTVPVSMQSFASPGVLHAVSVGLWLLCGAALVATAVAYRPGQSTPQDQGMVWRMELLGGSDTGGGFDSGWVPHFSGAEVVRRRWTARDSGEGVPVEMFLAYYRKQSLEARLSDPANSLTGEAWHTTASQLLQGPATPDGRVWLELRGIVDGSERLLWARYEVAGAVAWSKLTLRAREVQGMLTGQRDGAAVALMAECSPDCDSARRAISAVLAAE
jgi:exosortase